MLTLLFRPIDTAVLIYFRFFAGVLLALELLSRPGPVNAIGAIAGFALAIGYRQRLAALLLCASYAYLFSLVPSSTELQLYLLVSFWLNFFPVKRQRAQSWLYHVLLYHAALVYGGLSFAFIPLLLLRRTRKAAFALACGFHILSAKTGTFPWFSIMMTALFFGTSWPRYFTWFDDFFVEFKEFQIPVTRKHQILAFAVVVYCGLVGLLPLRDHWSAGELVSLFAP